MSSISEDSDNSFKFKGGKIPTISYLLSEGFIKIINKSGKIWLENYTDLEFNFSLQKSNIIITLLDNNETYKVKLK